MNTKFFQETGLSRGSSDALCKFVALNEEARRKILKWFAEAGPDYIVDANVVSTLAQESGEAAPLIIIALNLLNNLAMAMGRFNDSPENFINDLKEAETLEKDEHYDVTLDILKQLQPNARDIFIANKRNTVDQKGAPVLKGGNMTCSIRPVYLRDFRYGRDEISSYEPKPEAYTVCAQIELSLNKIDGDESFAFTVDRNVLNRFITDLLVLQKQLNQMLGKVDLLSGKGK